MNNLELNIDLYAFSKPTNRAELLTLIKEMRAEIARVNAHFDSLFEEAPCPTDA